MKENPMPKYVQHKSGVGRKWKVDPDMAGMDGRDQYRVHDTRDLYCLLPKSEYIEVPAPEQWDDVTSECTEGTDTYTQIWHDYNLVYGNNRYRLRKVQTNLLGNAHSWAFIVEKRVA